MKYLTFLCLLLSLVFIGCNSTPSFERAVKKYMADSVVVKFDDPSSYQYVSMDKPDSVFKHQMYADNLTFNKRMISETEKTLESNKAELKLDESAYKGDTTILRIDNRNIKTSMVELAGYKENLTKDSIIMAQPDTLVAVNVAVSVRAKNKLGALVLDKINLQYDPQAKTFTPFQKQ